MVLLLLLLLLLDFLEGEWLEEVRRGDGERVALGGADDVVRRVADISRAF